MGIGSIDFRRTVVELKQTVRHMYAHAYTWTRRVQWCRYISSQYSPAVEFGAKHVADNLAFLERVAQFLKHVTVRLDFRTGAYVWARHNVLHRRGALGVLHRRRTLMWVRPQRLRELVVHKTGKLVPNRLWYSAELDHLHDSGRVEKHGVCARHTPPGVVGRGTEGLPRRALEG
jgi:hypothetical protein